MKYEQLCERLRHSSQKGYKSSDTIISEGGFGRAALAGAIIAESIKERYFDANRSSTETLKSLEERVNWLRLRHRNVEEYMGNLVGVEEWREDNAKDLIIRWKKGYLFPSKGKTGIPIIGFRKIITDDDYYRGFGKPGVYGKEEGERMIELGNQVDLMNDKFVCGLLAMFGSIPITIGLKALRISDPITIAIFLSYTAFTGGYVYKLVQGKFGKKGVISKMNEVPQKFKEEESIKKLYELYAIE